MDILYCYTISILDMFLIHEIHTHVCVWCIVYLYNYIYICIIK